MSERLIECTKNFLAQRKRSLPKLWINSQLGSDFWLFLFFNHLWTQLKTVLMSGLPFWCRNLYVLLKRLYYQTRISSTFLNTGYYPEKAYTFPTNSSSDLLSSGIVVTPNVRQSSVSEQEHDRRSYSLHLTSNNKNMHVYPISNIIKVTTKWKLW